MSMMCDTCHKVLKFIKETKKWLCPCCGQSTPSVHFWNLPKEEREAISQK